MRIQEAQLQNYAKYRQTIKKRGDAKNFNRFVEEVGELSKAIRDMDETAGKPLDAIDKAYIAMEREFADVFAWLITLAEVHEVSLESAYINKYGGRICFRCEQENCICPEGSAK